MENRGNEDGLSVEEIGMERFSKGSSLYADHLCEKYAEAIMSMHLSIKSDNEFLEIVEVDAFIDGLRVNVRFAIFRFIRIPSYFHFKLLDGGFLCWDGDLIEDSPVIDALTSYSIGMYRALFNGKRRSGGRQFDFESD